MPRVAREKSESGIYHIMVRGINRQEIFVEEEDYIRFIQTLERFKEISNYDLYAYCLMGNHVHILLKEGPEPLSTIMRRIGSSYVLWYNKKYNRVGYLFQGRFKSEPVENDSYFFIVLRYILQNPVKAGLVSTVADYKWSNYNDYISDNDKSEIKRVFAMFHQKRATALAAFIEFVNAKNDDKCLDLDDTKRVTDKEAMKIITEYCKIEYPQRIQGFEISTRNRYLKDLKEVHGLSVRQIERLTGINRGVVQRA